MKSVTSDLPTATRGTTCRFDAQGGAAGGVSVNDASQVGSGYAPGPVQARTWSRTSGYLVSIVIDMILLYAAQHLLEWNVPWITAEWSEVVWAVSLSLTISIVASALLLVYDEQWFHHLADFVATGAALVAGYWIYVVFPFDFGAEWNSLAHLVLGAVLLGLAIATVVIAVLAIAELLRAGWGQLTHP
jgi:hypothetical protein